jgi:flagellar biosynthesis/type III secretory pathway protein FliH
MNNSDYEQGYDDSYEKSFLSGKEDGKNDKLKHNNNRLNVLFFPEENIPSNDYERGCVDGRTEGYTKGYSEGYRNV